LKNKVSNFQFKTNICVIVLYEIVATIASAAQLAKCIFLRALHFFYKNQQIVSSGSLFLTF